MHNERRRGQRPGATIKYLLCTSSGATGNGLGTTIKYLRGAAGIGLGTTIKYLRGAAGIGLRTTTKYLWRSTSGAAGNGLWTMIKYLRVSLLCCTFEALLSSSKELKSVLDRLAPSPVFGLVDGSSLTALFTGVLLRPESAMRADSKRGLTKFTTESVRGALRESFRHVP
jgi:hypothetical protein